MAGRPVGGQPDRRHGDRAAHAACGLGGTLRRPDRRRQFRAVLQDFLPGHRRGDHRPVGGVRARPTGPSGRVLRAAALLHPGHEPDGDVPRIAHGLHCPGAAVLQPVRHGGLRTARGPFQRGWHQVHHHRRAVLGHHALRAEQHLRRPGHHLLRRHRRGVGVARHGQPGPVGGRAHCWWSVWVSSSRRSPSTCGPPTPTRARPCR